VEAREESDGGVLGGDLTVVGGSVRWTGELSDRADVVAHGGSWKDGQNLLVARGISKLAEISQIHRNKAEKPLLVVILAERVTVVARLARAVTTGGARRADDGGSSTDL
jgi:hypothetical protein